MRADARRALAALAAALALVLGLLVALVAPAQPARADEAGTLHALLNQARAGQGLGSLGRMSALDQAALDWARAMAASGTLAHNPAGPAVLPAGWSRWGENVAQGYPTAQAMHDGWWNSAGHRGNILGDFTHVGLAFLSAGGTTWGVQVFAKYGASGAAPAPAPAAPAPAAPAPAPEAAATPDPQPTVIDPKPVPDPSLLPSAAPTPSASPSEGTSPDPSPSQRPDSSSEPEDERGEPDEAGAVSPWTWLWVVLLLAVVALGLLPLQRRRRGRRAAD